MVTAASFGSVVLRRLPLMLVSFAGSWVIHTYLMVVVNEGFDGGPASPYINGPGNIISSAVFWAAVSGILWSFLLGMFRHGPVRALTALVEPPIQMARSFQAAGKAGLAALGLGGGAALVASFLINQQAAFSLAILWAMLGLGPVGQWMARMLMNQLPRLGAAFAQKAGQKFQLDLRGAQLVASALSPGFLVAALVPSGTRLLLGVVFLVGGFFLWVQAEATGAAVGCLLAGAVIEVLWPGSVLAHDGGWKEAGGTWQGWINSQGAIQAIIRGLFPAIFGGLGPLFAPFGEAGFGPASGPGPIMDPWTGKPLTVWEPGRYGPGADGNPGRPGQVWFGGNWVDPDYARDFIRDSLAADQRREAESQQFWEESQQLSEQAMRNRRRTLEAEAAEEQRQRNLRSQLDNIRGIADRQGFDDIWDRAVGSGGIRPDGTIDPDYVERLRNTLRGRLGREMNEPPDPGYRSPFDDFVDGVRHSTIARIAAGIASGGTSEIFFQSQAAWEAMQRSFNDAANRGRDWGFTDAVRAGFGQLIRENLPVNTLEVLRGDPKDITLENLLASGASDIFSAWGTYQTGRNLRNSLDGARAGASWGDVLGSRFEPPSPGRVPRNVKDMPEGSPVTYRDYGMPDKNGFSGQQLADRHLVNIEVRPTNPDSIARLAQGDHPKPMSIKANSINPLDVELGAPPGEVGRVAHFKPRMPDTTGMDPGKAADLTRRYNNRMNSYNALDAEMRAMQAAGDVKIEANGLIRNGKDGKPYTGDHDIFRITDSVTGREVPAGSRLYDNVVNDLKKPPFQAQHGAHSQWRYDPADPHHGAQYRNTDARIRAEHSPSGTRQGDMTGGGQSLINFGPGQPPRASYFNGPIDPFAPPPGALQ